ncbi:MAG: NAD-dependent epimerase/dehydratase family protein [Solirubrobacteraceae bacterium]|jgi:UDP-glucose 4-epimerase
MRVLVTGGSGFIGSHVLDRLVEAGWRPRNFDLRPSPHHHPDQIETVIGDLLDPAALTRAMEGCDFVVHLAAAADVGIVAREPRSAEEVNARGTLNVLEAARAAGVRRVVYGSTIWVYGSVPNGLVDEDTALGLPDHLYTATKLAGEMYCRSYRELYGLEYTILRFGIPYGPRARPAAVIPTFIGKALAGEALTVAGDGRQTRRLIYVEDLAEGVVRALEPSGANRTFNLVTDETVTILEIAHTVRDLVGEVEVVHGPSRAADFGGTDVSGVRAAAELGWSPATSFRTGVRRYLEWHLAQADDEPVAQPEERRVAIVEEPRADPAPERSPVHRVPALAARALLPAARAYRVAMATLLTAVAVAVLVKLHAGTLLVSPVKSVMGMVADHTRVFGFSAFFTLIGVAVVAGALRRQDASVDAPDGAPSRSSDR